MGSPMSLGGLGPGSVAPPAKSLWTFRIRLAGLSLGMQHQHCPPMGSLVRPCLTQSLPHQCQARHRQAQWGALSSAGDPNQASEELQCPQTDSHSSGSPPQTTSPSPLSTCCHSDSYNPPRLGAAWTLPTFTGSLPCCPSHLEKCRGHQCHRTKTRMHSAPCSAIETADSVALGSSHTLPVLIFPPGSQGAFSPFSTCSWPLSTGTLFGTMSEPRVLPGDPSTKRTLNTYE